MKQVFDQLYFVIELAWRPGLCCGNERSAEVICNIKKYRDNKLYHILHYYGYNCDH